MRVIWTARARRRLFQIEDHIARDNPSRAVTFVLELVDVADNLALFPESGHPPKERPDGPYRQIVHDGYRIVFRRSEDTVFITSVFDGRRQLRASDLES